MILRLPLRPVLLLACAILLVISVTGSAAALDKKDQQGRLLSGKVLDPQDNPVVSAIVYLTNTRTHAVKTYMSDRTAPTVSRAFPTWIMKSTPSTTAIRVIPNR